MTGRITGQIQSPGSAGLSAGVADAWVKFDLAGTVNASHNVDSVTDTGTGDWTVNITTDLPSADYCIVTSMRVDTGSDDLTPGMGSQAAGSFQILSQIVQCSRKLTAGRSWVLPQNFGNFD